MRVVQRLAVESVEPLQILRLTLGWIGTMNLTKGRPVGFNGLTGLTMSLVCRPRRKAWGTHQNKGVNDKQWQAMTSYLNWGCVAHQHHQPGVYVGSKRITKASNVWHVRCHCVYMGKIESKTCWSSLSRIGVDAGLKHTGGILSM